MKDPHKRQTKLWRHCVRCGLATDAPLCPNDRAPTVLAKPKFRDSIPEGAVLHDRYRIGALLARGSYGSVYQAENMSTGHFVAIKALDPMPGDDLVTTARRFFREAAATSRLSHPNTVRVFDFGQTDHGELFLAMELLRGQSVAARLQRTIGRGRVMTPRLVAMIGVGVLRSLAEAHAVGLVHRDLKPENVFLHEAGPDDLVVKVVDFGVAMDRTSPMTVPGTQVGTATHMSPEQVAGGEVDHRADIYSVGVLLYECLAGTLPFEGNNAYLMAMAHVLEAPRPLSEFVPRLAGTAIEAVLTRALQKKPSDRWQSALDMRRALLAAVGKDDLYLLDSSFQSSMLPAEDVTRSAMRISEMPTAQIPRAKPTEDEGYLDEPVNSNELVSPDERPPALPAKKRTDSLKIPVFAPRPKKR